MNTKINQQEVQSLLAKINDSYKEFTKTYSGALKTRQPIHTVYGGAHLFNSQVTQKLGINAKKIFLEYAPNPIFFAKRMQLHGYQELPKNKQQVKNLIADIPQNYPAAWFAHKVWSRVLEKLEAEAIEDFRIDFEDGFGVRSDEEEDKVAEQAAKEVLKGIKEKSLPPFIGIRIKSFDNFAERSIRTLDIFLSNILATSPLPKNFVITFPKVAIEQHISALVEILEKIENAYSLPIGSLKIELMVELTQTIINQKGSSHIWNLVKASKGRCRGLHFGTYDYTASCDVIAHFQAMDNPVCDFAKHFMQTTAMGTGLMISDGATNIFPVALYPKSTNSAEIAENVDYFYNAWRIQFANIHNSLHTGFYQGWDLHPAQLPIRYAACYAFYLQEYEQIYTRMKNFLAISGKAVLSGNVFDDAATGQGLINFFLKAFNCGAIAREDITSLSISPEVLQTRSFPKIIAEYQKNQ